jgi:hypothetical protein
MVLPFEKTVLGPVKKWKITVKSKVEGMTRAPLPLLALRRSPTHGQLQGKLPLLIKRWVIFYHDAALLAFWWSTTSPASRD